MTNTRQLGSCYCHLQHNIFFSTIITSLLSSTMGPYHMTTDLSTSITFALSSPSSHHQRQHCDYGHTDITNLSIATITTPSLLSLSLLHYHYHHHPHYYHHNHHHRHHHPHNLPPHSHGPIISTFMVCPGPWLVLGPIVGYDVGLL